MTGPVKTLLPLLRGSPYDGKHVAPALCQEPGAVPQHLVKGGVRDDSQYGLRSAQANALVCPHNAGRSRAGARSERAHRVYSSVDRRVRSGGDCVHETLAHHVTPLGVLDG